MSAETLLARLEKVRRTGSGRWIACCPSHADKSPSLSIRETPEGKVLLHCFSGCSVGEIVGAAGVDLADLFPPGEHHGKPETRAFPATDALRCIGFEALVVAAAASAMIAGEPLAAVDRERLLQASARIQDALRVCHL